MNDPWYTRFGWWLWELAIMLLVPCIVLGILFGTALGAYSIVSDNDNDYNRLVTAQAYRIDAGLQDRPYFVVNTTKTTANADTAHCIFNGRDLFSPGATSTVTGPATEITIDTGSRWTGQHLVRVTVPDSKLPSSLDSTTHSWVKFEFQRVPLYFDHTWDAINDGHAGGQKAAVVSCMNGLSPGQLLSIGLRQVVLHENNVTASN